MQEKLANFFVYNGIVGEVYSSLIVMLFICILAIIAGIMARKQDPLKKPKGLLLLAEFGVSKMDAFAVNMMGPSFKGFGGYLLVVVLYLFLSFIIGLFGLPSPTTYFAIPLSLAMLTFFLIHATSIKYTKWKYFQRYIDPFPVFLPINLLSMWAPLLSLSLRLFGNAISGWTIMTIVYAGLKALSSAVFSSLPEGLNSIFFAPLITSVLHLYFDLFSAYIQTTVFVSLTAIFIGQEKPSDL